MLRALTSGQHCNWWVLYCELPRVSLQMRQAGLYSLLHVTAYCANVGKRSAGSFLLFNACKRFLDTAGVLEQLAEYAGDAQAYGCAQ